MQPEVIHPPARRMDPWIRRTFKRRSRKRRSSRPRWPRSVASQRVVGRFPWPPFVSKDMGRSRSCTTAAPARIRKGGGSPNLLDLGSSVLHWLSVTMTMGHNGRELVQAFVTCQLRHQHKFNNRPMFTDFFFWGSLCGTPTSFPNPGCLELGNVLTQSDHCKGHFTARI